MLDYFIQNLEGKRFLDFVHPNDLEGKLATIFTLSTQHEGHRFREPIWCRDGSY